MKREWKPTVVTALAAPLVVTVSGVVLAGGPGWKGGANGGTSVTPTAGKVSGPGTATAIIVPLGNAEKEALLLMREEEKLARDVYNTFYAQWGARVFNNIATSESRHVASIKTLLDRCGLTDPVGVARHIDSLGHHPGGTELAARLGESPGRLHDDFGDNAPTGNSARRSVKGLRPSADIYVLRIAPWPTAKGAVNERQGTEASDSPDCGDGTACHELGGSRSRWPERHRSSRSCTERR